MDLLEHQGKELFAKAGLPVMAGETAWSPAEAVAAARRIGLPVVVKAQVKTGGRGKAGGVRRCATLEDVEAAAAAVLAMKIKDRPVECVLIEEAADIAREMYLAFMLSRADRGPVLVFAREGGVDIESIARRDPDALIRRPIDPLLGLCDYQVRDVLAAAGVPRKSFAGRALGAVVKSAWDLYYETDASLLEVNPLALTPDGAVVCLDAKVTVDDSALFRHPDFLALAEAGLDERELKARRAGLAFVPLDGDIGVVGNGAGSRPVDRAHLDLAGRRSADARPRPRRLGLRLDLERDPWAPAARDADPHLVGGEPHAAVVGRGAPGRRHARRRARQPQGADPAGGGARRRGARRR